MDPLNIHQERFLVDIDSHALVGEMMLPDEPIGLVIFAHGSASGRLSPRNTWVARHLNSLRIGTVMFDLLSQAETLDRNKVFDIALLTQRMGAVLAWCRRHPELADTPVGLYGASTGAAAALSVAAARPAQVSAVVSRGGRPDLAVNLTAVRAPTLLIVGGDDHATLQVNRIAFDHMRCEKKLVVVPGATHLFEEPGALDRVAQISGQWFGQHLPHMHPTH